MVGAIPAWGLYGEVNADQIGDYHIEPLGLRSAAHDWEIAPHLHKGLSQLFVLVSGRFSASVDGVALELTAPAVLTMPPAAAHAFSFAPGSEGFVITFRNLTHPLLDPVAARVVTDSLFSRPTLIDLSGETSAAAQLERLMDNLASAQACGDGALTGALYLTSALVLLEVARRAAPADTGPEQGAPVRAFLTLIDRHFTEHWTVSAYARALSMSEASLDRVCRQTAGRTPFQLIRDRLMMEARRRLTYTLAPAAAIAADLGFNDPAYFSRFIKANTGVSPRDLRAAGDGHMKRPTAQK